MVVVALTIKMQLHGRMLTHEPRVVRSLSLLKRIYRTFLKILKLQKVHEFATIWCVYFYSVHLNHIFSQYLNFCSAPLLFRTIYCHTCHQLHLIYLAYYGRLWPAVYIIFVQITQQIQVLTEPLCRAQAIFMRRRTTSGVPNIVGLPTSRSKTVCESVGLPIARGKLVCEFDLFA